MRIELEPGVYVVAVSGGVDSIVLLHLLTTNCPLPATKFIVAHFDHGMRSDSAEDRKFVEKLAEKYRLPFVYDIGELGPNASEESARKARYKFLQRVREISGAKAVITAHHQDDLIETAIINILRGTGRKGLSSLKSRDEILRPLLDFSKAEIKIYAEKHKLQWHEDPSNQDTRYLRNYVRHQIVGKLTKQQREKFINLLKNAQKTNTRIDLEIAKLSIFAPDNTSLDRKYFNNLPHAVALEVLAEWLRKSRLQFDRKLLDKLVVGIKTLVPGKHLDIDSNYFLKLTQDKLMLVKR